MLYRAPAKFYRAPATPVVPRERIPPAPPKAPKPPKLTIPDNLEPVVHFFFTELLRQGVPTEVVAQKTGLHRATIATDWRLRHCPRIADFEAALNVLGWTLVPMPLNREAAE